MFLAKGLLSTDMFFVSPTGYIYANGLSEVMVGLSMSLAGATGILGTFAFTWFRRRVGLERTGLFAFNFELLCLTLTVVSVWAPGSLFQPASLFNPPKLGGQRNCTGVTGVVPVVGNSSELTGYHDVENGVVPQGCGERALPKEKISILLFLVGVITSRVGECVCKHVFLILTAECGCAIQICF